MDIKTKNRPTGALVIGILFIIYGSMGLLGACCGAAGIGMLAAIPRDHPAFRDNPTILLQQSLADNSPLYVPGMIATMGLGLVICVGELVAGIGLLRMRPWARRLGLAVAGLILFQGVLNAAFQVFVVIPGSDRFWSNPPAQLPPMPPQMRDINRITSSAGLIGVLPSFAYAIAALIVLTRPKLRDAFAGVPAQLPPEAAEDDDPRWSGQGPPGVPPDEGESPTGITEKRPE